MITLEQLATLIDLTADAYLDESWEFFVAEARSVVETREWEGTLKKDWKDVRWVAEYIRRGEVARAIERADKLDTFVRDQLPGLFWTVTDIVIYDGEIDATQRELSREKDPQIRAGLREDLRSLMDERWLVQRKQAQLERKQRTRK